eukprot:4842425-Alexandrium_andersonii.AAC.1
MDAPGGVPCSKCRPCRRVGGRPGEVGQLPQEDGQPLQYGEHPGGGPRWCRCLDPCHEGRH